MTRRRIRVIVLDNENDWAYTTIVGADGKYHAALF